MTAIFEDEEDEEPRHAIFVDGRIAVMGTRCPTCIFRPGNLMHLDPGVVERMVADATERESTIVCHSTLDLDRQAACHGFVDRHATLPLRLGYAYDVVDEVTLDEL
jgi:hypothetical protein